MCHSRRVFKIQGCRIEVTCERQLHDVSHCCTRSLDVGKDKAVTFRWWVRPRT